jgi:hypothetical protein
VQRAGADKLFGKIISVVSSDNLVSYNLTDQQPLAGINYYRLNIKTGAGDSILSRVVQVIVQPNDRMSISLTPAIVSSNSILSVQSDRRRGLNFAISDMQGRILFQLQRDISTGLTNIPLNLSHLQPGVYVLEVIDKYNNKRERRKFLKR